MFNNFSANNQKFVWSQITLNLRDVSISQEQQTEKTNKMLDQDKENNNSKTQGPFYCYGWSKNSNLPLTIKSQFYGRCI